MLKSYKWFPETLRLQVIYLVRRMFKPVGAILCFSVSSKFTYG